MKKIKFSFGELSIKESERITEIVASQSLNTEKFKLLQNEFNWYVAQNILGPDPENRKLISYEEAMTRNISKISDKNDGDSITVFAEIIDIDCPWINSSKSFMFTAFARDKSNDNTFKITAFSTAVALYSNMKKKKRYIIHGVVEEYNERKELRLNNTLHSWMLEVEQTTHELTNKRKSDELSFTFADGVIVESDEIKEKRRIYKLRREERIRDAQHARCINESKTKNRGQSPL